MLPNFLVIGAPKCGTSTLCHLLGQHPDVFMSDPKEIHYFGRSDPEKTPAWYEAHFEGADGFTAVGEGSTSYTHPQIIERCVSEIGERIPDARLIYIVRHPIRRLESDWKMRKREGWAGDSINEDALEQDSLISHGLYWRNINRYRRRFSDEQILILFLEDFAESPEPELDRCFAHIGVDPSVDLEDLNTVKNSAGSHRRDTILSGWLKRIGLVSRVRRLLPQPLVSTARRALTRPYRVPSIDWDPGVRARVADELRDDARKLLDHCGKTSAFWDLD